MGKVFLTKLFIPYLKRSGIPHRRGAEKAREVWV